MGRAFQSDNPIVKQTNTQIFFFVFFLVFGNTKTLREKNVTFTIRCLPRTTPPIGESPALQIQSDLDLAVHLDRLGYESSGVVNIIQVAGR
ncbi:MAG: hypothetical protein CM1200mP39_16680 [Dehalococcoidia bacterium]|nr:MAG: hypothetical protein CM1200mP39_16680 [Dehalococcoidia bacterium]